MKIFRFLIPGFIYCAFPAPAKSQEFHPILSYFKATVFENKIQLNWAISGGNTCEGTIIQHSLDGISFETIGEIGGICGSTDFDVPYFFIDENPEANMLNFYRLELGSQGLSSAIGIEFIPFNDQGYSLRYDVNSQIFIINYENSAQEMVRFVLYDTNGAKTQEGVTTSSEIKLPLHNSSSQLFILHLMVAERKRIIKLMKY